MEFGRERLGYTDTGRREGNQQRAPSPMEINFVVSLSLTSVSLFQHLGPN